MKPEVSPPLLKKSRTISTDDPDPPPPHFPGPLFPAVRRTAASPPPPISLSDQRFGVSDRDYVYPSFLGPYSSRTRVTVKSSPSKTPQKSFDPPGPISTPPRPNSMHKAKLKQDRDLKSVPVQILANTLTSSASLPNSATPLIHRTSSGFRNSLFFNLVGLDCNRFRCLCVCYIMIAFYDDCDWFFCLLQLKFICVVSVSYAISLQNKVTKLQVSLYLTRNLQGFSLYMIKM